MYWSDCQCLYQFLTNWALPMVKGGAVRPAAMALRLVMLRWACLVPGQGAPASCCVGGRLSASVCDTMLSPAIAGDGASGGESLLPACLSRRRRRSPFFGVGSQVGAPPRKMAARGEGGLSPVLSWDFAPPRLSRSEPVRGRVAVRLVACQLRIVAQVAGAGALAPDNSIVVWVQFPPGR